MNNQIKNYNSFIKFWKLKNKRFKKKIIFIRKLSNKLIIVNNKQQTKTNKLVKIY